MNIVYKLVHELLNSLKLRNIKKISKNAEPSVQPQELLLIQDIGRTVGNSGDSRKNRDTWTIC